MSEREILQAALDKTDPAERAAYLDEACTGDATLRGRIEALLKASDGAGGFLDSLGGVAGASASAAIATPP